MIGLHARYALQTTITCDHTSWNIFPNKQIAHFIS